MNRVKKTMFGAAFFATIVTAGLLFSVPAAQADLDGWFDGSVDHPAIEYTTRPTHDPVAELNRKIQAGTAQMKFDDRQGYLRSVLEALNVPVESHSFRLARYFTRRSPHRATRRLPLRRLRSRPRRRLGTLLCSTTCAFLAL